MKHASIGSISTGTLRSEDLIEAFGSELEWQIQRNGDFLSRPENFPMRDRLNERLGEYQDAFNDSGELACEDESELIQSLENALNEFSGPYCYFGSHPGDGADFGYWPSFDSIDELPQIADNTKEAIEAEQSEGFSTDVRYVNDHGNVTVYSADGSVILELV